MKHLSYKAPAWLPGAHLQTVWPLLLRNRLLPQYRREQLDTPDGDFLDIDWIDGSSRDAPLLVLFHGLEGSSASPYAHALMQAVQTQGWRGVVVHFRGCSGRPNRLPRAYHSGDSAEVAWVLAQLQQRQAGAPLFAVGVSLGGNALLKYLGEQGSAARHIVSAAAAVSVPYDLAAADRCLSRGIARLYARHFLKTLIPQALAKAQRFPNQPGLNQPERIRNAKTLREFDDAVTAPLHGFRDADDYYTQSSSGQYVARIAVPALLLHALNDPFLPPTEIPVRATLPANVHLETSSDGGHVGFVSGYFPGQLNWLPERLLHEFSRSVHSTES
ncbi:MAG TPA: hydrolase [Rhodocyclaceae bacterium]|nr:hydrolase [Rhodocyclaceae bacterium]